MLEEENKWDCLLNPHNPQPLILLLPPLTPQRRLIFALFLLSIPLFLRRMDSSRIMLSRRINSYDLQRHVTNIQKLVLRARWHNYYVALFDDLLLSGHDGFASAVCEEQDLVDGMFLVKLEDISFSIARPGWEGWLSQGDVGLILRRRFLHSRELPLQQIGSRDPYG